MNDEISLIDIFKVLWSRRWIVVLGTLVFTIGGVVAAFVLPKSYEATATVFPVASGSSSGLSQYAGLASLAGIDLPSVSAGTPDPGMTVSALLGSRLLVEAVVRDMKLVEVLGSPPAFGGDATDEERFNAVVRQVQSGLRFDQEKSTGVIRVTLELPDPVWAQKVTNRLLEILDNLLVEKSLTTTRKKTESLNRQIEAQRTKLDEYQREMARFQKDTSLLDPRAQSGKAMDAYTSMIQQKMSLELQLSTAEASYSADNPRVTLLRNQLSNLDDQINRVKTQVGGDLPSLKTAPENLIRYQNLATDLEIATKIYAGLLASMEQAKLQDDKDQVYIEVLDTALLPTVGKPSRLVVVLVSALLGLLATAMGVFVWEAVRSYLRPKIQEFSPPQDLGKEKE